MYPPDFGVLIIYVFQVHVPMNIFFYSSHPPENVLGH